MLLTKLLKQSCSQFSDLQNLKSTLPRVTGSQDTHKLPSIEKHASHSKTHKRVMRMSPNKKYFPDDFFGSDKHQQQGAKINLFLSSTNSLSANKKLLSKQLSTGVFRPLEPLLQQPNTNPLIRKTMSAKLPLYKLFEKPIQKQSSLAKGNKQNQVFELTFSLNKLQQGIDKNRQNLVDGDPQLRGRLKLRKQSARRLKYKLI